MRTLVTFSNMLDGDHASPLPPQAQVLLSPTGPPRCMLIIALYRLIMSFKSCQQILVQILFGQFVFVTLVVKLVLQCFELTSFGRLELSGMKCECECARVCVWNDGNCASTVGFSAVSLKERFHIFLHRSFARRGNNNIIVFENKTSKYRAGVQKKKKYRRFHHCTKLIFVRWCEPHTMLII